MLFSLYRVLPFATLIFYDWLWVLAQHHKLVAKSWFDSWGFVAQLWLVPAVVLLLGGYLVRRLPPASRFGVAMIAVSLLAVLFNVLTINCYALAALGGTCA